MIRVNLRLNGYPLQFSSKEEAYTVLTAIAKGYKTNSRENDRCCCALAMLMLGKTDIDCLSNEAIQLMEATRTK